MTNDFEALTADELYLLHLEVAAVLRKKLVARKNALEERLSNYNRRNHTGPIQSKDKTPECGRHGRRQSTLN